MKKDRVKREERRKVKRHQVNVPFFILWAGQGGKKFKLRTIVKDIGEEGLSFAAGKDFPIAFPIDLKLLPDLPQKNAQPRTLRLKGEVVWSRMIKNDIFRSGVCFVKLSSREQKRVKKYLSRLIKRS